MKKRCKKLLPNVPMIVASSRPEWLQKRSQGIGASDAATVLGASPWSDPLTLFLEKVGLKPGAEENESMRWGQRLQPIVAEEHQLVTGRPITDPSEGGKFVIHQHPQIPWCLSTLDYLQEDKERGLGVLEIKTTSAFKEEDWIEEPPLHYQVQVQHQLAVTGLSWGSLSVLIGGQKFITFDIERDEEFIELMLAHEETFWKGVLANEAPPPNGSESAAYALELLYPKHKEGVVVPLPHEALETDERLSQIKESIKQLETEERELKAQIKSWIGDAERGALPGNKGFWDWKVVEKKAYEVKASSSRQLRRVKK